MLIIKKSMYTLGYPKDQFLYLPQAPTLVSSSVQLFAVVESEMAVEFEMATGLLILADENQKQLLQPFES